MPSASLKGRVHIQILCPCGHGAGCREADGRVQGTEAGGEVVQENRGGEPARLCCGGGGGATSEDSGLGGGVGGRGGLRSAPPGLGWGRGWRGGRETAARVAVVDDVVSTLEPRPSLRIVPSLTPTIN